MTGIILTDDDREIIGLYWQQVINARGLLKVRNMSRCVNLVELDFKHMGNSREISEKAIEEAQRNARHGQK